ncbi:MAG: hypothetical protein ACRDZU_12685 [Acidimicrobiales bacterium]
MTPPLSERFERSSLGQFVASAGVVLVLLCQVGTHLPPSAVHRAVGPTANQMVRVLASEQAWGVFAPNPRATSLQVEGRVTFADGSTTVWTLPEGPNLGANLRYYRWRKWLERIRSDSYRDIWEPTARWIASLYEDERSPVVRVDLVRRFRDNALTGEQPPYKEFTYFTLDLDDAP